MADFLDFISSAADYIPGGKKAIPSWLTGLLVRKPKSAIDPSAAIPYYNAVGQAGANADQFANEQASFYSNNYRPAALSFAKRAAGVGGFADLADASARSAAGFDQSLAATRASLGRDMKGVDPNSGAAMARRGAIDAAAPTGRVHAMNLGRNEREKYGDTLRATALPFLATTPDFGRGAAINTMAGRGMSDVSRTQDDIYRRQVGDVMKTMQLPQAQADNAARAKKNEASQGGVIQDVMRKYMPEIFSRFTGAWQGDDMSGGSGEF